MPRRCEESLFHSTSEKGRRAVMVYIRQGHAGNRGEDKVLPPHCLTAIERPRAQPRSIGQPLGRADPKNGTRGGIESEEDECPFVIPPAGERLRRVLEHDLPDLTRMEGGCQRSGEQEGKLAEAITRYLHFC